MKLYILIATYNGEKYIDDQINSIISQKGIEPFHILIRDDNSNDNTPDIIGRIANDHQNIEIIRDSLGNLNAKGNFNLLVKAAIEREADYVMFADQDDIWKEDKIEKTLKHMQEGESRLKTNTPLLVHTDLCVVDDNLKIIHLSFMEYQHIHHVEYDSIKTLLVQNFVTGCTVMVNRALLNTAHPVPDEALMYDWWYALCAATFGNILFISEATLLYRQHKYNKIGSKGYWSTLFNKSIQRPHDDNTNSGITYYAIKLSNIINQAKYLLSLTHKKTDAQSNIVQQLQEFCQIFQTNISPLQKIMKFHRLGIKRQDINSDIILKLLVLFS